MASVVRYLCNDPGHPPVFEVYGQPGLYDGAFSRVSDLLASGQSERGVVESVSARVLSALPEPPTGWESGPRIQEMRRDLAQNWGPVFNQIENLAHFTGWLSLDLLDDDGTDQQVLASLAIYAGRPLLAAVNQYRAGLAGETFGYWRTLYENLIKSRFLMRFGQQDLELAGRFMHHTLRKYRDFNSLMAEFYPLSSETKAEADSYWENAVNSVEAYHRKEAKGDYAWAYPLVKGKGGKPNPQPTFRHLVDMVDPGSIYAEVYYRTSSAQEHGQLLWSHPITAVVNSMSIGYDPYSTGDVVRMLELTLPVYRETVSNAGASLGNPVYRCLMETAELGFEEVERSVAVFKSQVGVSLGGA